MHVRQSSGRCSAETCASRQCWGGAHLQPAQTPSMHRQPRLIICDEATSALDSATEQSIVRSLDDLIKGRTAILVAHRLSTVQVGACLHARAGAKTDRGDGPCPSESAPLIQKTLAAAQFSSPKTSDPLARPSPNQQSTTKPQGCDRIYVMQDGRVVEAGSHKKLLAAGGLYAEMWQLQEAEKVGVAGCELVWRRVVHGGRRKRGHARDGWLACRSLQDSAGQVTGRPRQRVCQQRPRWQALHWETALRFSSVPPGDPRGLSPHPAQTIFGSVDDPLLSPGQGVPELDTWRDGWMEGWRQGLKDGVAKTTLGGIPAASNGLSHPSSAVTP